MSMHSSTDSQQRSRALGRRRAEPAWTPPAPTWRPGVGSSGAAVRPASTRPWDGQAPVPWRPFAPPETKPARHYWPGLDGLRALAVVGVLLYHSGIAWIPGGFLGVDLFFVISGYLITSLLITELERHGAISYTGFYLRRARRLLPALFLMLFVTAAAVVFLWPQELPKIRGDLLASFGYVTNWWFIVKHQSYFAASGRPSPFQHLWSLAVEEQFYLVWPAVVGLVLAGRSSVRRLTSLGVLAIAGAVASTVWMAVIAIHQNVPYGADASRVYMGTDTHAMGVLMGAGVAALIAAWERSPRIAQGNERLTRVLDVAGGVGLVGVCLAMVFTSEFVRGLYRGGFLGFAVIAALPVMAVARPNSHLGSALGWAPLRWIGTRSYALYLWHWPIFVFTRPQLDVPFTGAADLALRLALTVGAAEASYRLVEQPIRTEGFNAYLEKLKRIPAKWRPAVFAYSAGLVIALALAIFLFAAAPGPSASTFFNQISVARSTHASPTAVARTQVANPVSVSSTRGPSAPAPPPVTAAPGPLSVTMVEDSVMLGAATDLRQALPGSNVDAVEGRQASEAFTTMLGLLSSGNLAHDVVLQIGTNGTIDAGALNSLLDRLAGHKIVLLNVHVPRPWAAPDNDTISSAAKTHANVELIDWDAIADAHPDWFWNDGIHLRPGGAQAYTDLILTALK